MRWLDLSGYGVGLKVGTGVGDEGVLFVEHADRTVADGLRRSGFHQTPSNVWFCKFEVHTCCDVLDKIAGELALAAFRDIDQKIVFWDLGQFLQPARVAIEGEVAATGDIVKPQVPPDLHVERDASPPAKDRLTSRLLGGLGRAVGWRRPARKERLNFKWMATTTAEDARRLSGIADLAPGNYFVGALDAAADREIAERRRGGHASSSFGQLLVLALTSGRTGSGFGSDTDALIIGIADFACGPAVKDEAAQVHRAA
jgi:hypothetical protein